MKCSDNDIKKIIEKYLDGSLSSEESSHLFSYLKEHNELADFDEIALREWEKAMTESSELSSFQKVALENEAKGIILKHTKKKVVSVKTIGNRILYRWIGAVACIAIVFTIVGLSFYSPEKPYEMRTIYSDAGKTKLLRLPDGSNVSLNAVSCITAPSAFQGGERRVSLSGEAFFNVAHNERKPFLIDAGDIIVKVLGTSFDVKNYKDDECMHVSVATGVVKVWDKNGNVILLQKDEELAINKRDGSFQKVRTNVNNIGAWREGRLTFNKTPLSEVINTIKRYYAVNIELSNIASDYQLTGEHDNKSLDAVLESVCFSTNLKLKKEKDKIVLFQ